MIKYTLKSELEISSLRSFELTLYDLGVAMGSAFTLTLGKIFIKRLIHRQMSSNEI